MAEERAPPHLCARPTLGLRTLLHGRADSVGRHKGVENRSAMTGGVRERGSVARGGGGGGCSRGGWRSGGVEWAQQICSAQQS